VSTQAVYDVLAACTTAGLVRRIEPAGHPARFERRAAATVPDDDDEKNPTHYEEAR
jgi:Fe2+ or Zn2+ uptake regulation protein